MSCWSDRKLSRVCQCGLDSSGTVQGPMASAVITVRNFWFNKIGQFLERARYNQRLSKESTAKLEILLDVTEWSWCTWYSVFVFAVWQSKSQANIAVLTLLWSQAVLIQRIFVLSKTFPTTAQKLVLCSCKKKKNLLRQRYFCLARCSDRHVRWLLEIRKFSTDLSVIFRRVRKIAKCDYQLRRDCPSVRVEQLVSHWTNFHEILYVSFFFENRSRMFRFH